MMKLLKKPMEFIASKAMEEIDRELEILDEEIEEAVRCINENTMDNLTLMVLKMHKMN